MTIKKKVSEFDAVSSFNDTDLLPAVRPQDPPSVPNLNVVGTIAALRQAVLRAVFPGADFAEATHAGLTTNYPPAQYAGKLAWVMQTTGLLWTKKYSGWYISDGTNWLPAEPPALAAGAVNVDSSAMDNSAGNDAQSVLQDFDAVLSAARSGIIGAAFDGSGSVIDAGAEATVRVHFSGTITKVTVLGDQPGSVVLDVQKDSYANYPPSGADSICGSSKPTISGGIKTEDTALTGWNKTVSAGDVFRFAIVSASGITKCAVQLEVNKT